MPMAVPVEGENAALVTSPTSLPLARSLVARAGGSWVENFS